MSCTNSDNKKDVTNDDFETRESYIHNIIGDCEKMEYCDLPEDNKNKLNLFWKRTIFANQSDFLFPIEFYIEIQNYTNEAYQISDSIGRFYFCDGINKWDVGTSMLPKSISIYENEENFMLIRLPQLDLEEFINIANLIEEKKDLYIEFVTQDGSLLKVEKACDYSFCKLFVNMHLH